MSVDYSAKLVIGVLVEPEKFFFEERTEIQVVCAHAEAEGQRFCPVCGTAAKDRRVEKTIKVVKAPFARVLDLEDIDFDYTDWLYDLRVGGLELVQASSMMGEENVYVFGEEVGRVGGYRDVIVHEPVTDTISTIAVVGKKLKDLGIEEEPSTFLAMSCG